MIGQPKNTREVRVHKWYKGIKSDITSDISFALILKSKYYTRCKTILTYDSDTLSKFTNLAPLKSDNQISMLI